MKQLVLSVLRVVKNLIFRDEVKFRKIPTGICKGLWFPLNFHQGFDIRLYLGLVERELKPYFTRYIAKSQCCYDVGADIGFVTLAMASHLPESGKVYAFEPLSESCENFRKTLNHNLEARPSAVKAEVELIEGFVGDHQDSDKQMISIDTMVYEEGHRKPDFIKIDIEGGELKALEGAKRVLEEHHPNLIIEVHSKALEDQCLAFLQGLGYHVDIVDQNALLPEYRPLPHNRWLCGEKTD